MFFKCHFQASIVNGFPDPIEFSQETVITGYKLIKPSPNSACKWVIMMCRCNILLCTFKKRWLPPPAQGCFSFFFFFAMHPLNQHFCLSLYLPLQAWNYWFLCSADAAVQIPTWWVDETLLISGLCKSVPSRSPVCFNVVGFVCPMNEVEAGSGVICCHLAPSEPSTS